MGYIAKPGIVRINPTVTNLLPGQFWNEEPIQSYPFGPTTMRVTNLAGGFPEEIGDVITSRTSENTGHQIFVGAKTYFRTFGAGTWSSWREFGATGGVTSVNNKIGDVILTADDVGAETPEGAQTKANVAEDNAKAYADQIVAAHKDQRLSDGDDVHGILTELTQRSVNVKWFGAVGDGIADDTMAINAAFAEAFQSNTNIYFPQGVYKISAPIGNPSNSLDAINIKIYAEPQTKIICQPQQAMRYAINIQHENIKTLIIDGLEIDCSEKVNQAICIRSYSFIDRISIKNCKMRDMRGLNVSGMGVSVSGILVLADSGGEFCEVKNCVIQNVSREVFTVDGGNLYTSGITVTGFNTNIIKYNNVSGVLTDSTNKQDADGIKVFNDNIPQGGKKQSTIIIEGNTVADCEGRWIKLQSKGNVNVVYNLFEIKGEIDLIENWSGIDAQMGNGRIDFNKFSVGNLWTGGTSAKLCSLQTMEVAEYSKEFMSSSFSNNEGIILKRIPYCIIPVFDYLNTQDMNVEFFIHNNTFTTDEDLTSADQTKVAFAYFIYNALLKDIVGSATLDVNNNKVFSYEFIRLEMSSEQYAKDLTGKLFLFISNNIKYPSGYSRDILYLSGENVRINTSSIRVYNNNMGNNFNSRWWGKFDILKLLAGNTFSVSSTLEIQNRPVGFTDGLVKTEGTVKKCLTHNKEFQYLYDSEGWYVVNYTKV